eukprot:2302067-Rhodomonas_salina.1
MAHLAHSVVELDILVALGKGPRRDALHIVVKLFLPSRVLMHDDRTARSKVHEHQKQTVLPGELAEPPLNRRCQRTRAHTQAHTFTKAQPRKGVSLTHGHAPKVNSCAKRVRARRGPL